LVFFLFSFGFLFGFSFSLCRYFVKHESARDCSTLGGFTMKCVLVGVRGIECVLVCACGDIDESANVQKPLSAENL